MQDGAIKLHFKKVDPTIYAILKDLNLTKWVRRRPASQFFSRICEMIIGQQLSDKAATTIFKRFLALLPNQKVTPEAVLTIPQESMRNAGMSWAKVSYVQNLAAQTKKGVLDLAALPRLTDEAVIRELTKIKGIGSWTAEMFLIFSLGREDVYSHGDQGLKTAIAKLYTLKKPSRSRIDRIVSKWKPYRSYGCIALWHSIDSKK